MENEQEPLDALVPEEAVVPETTNATMDDYLKVQEDYNSQKIRAEKAERELKALKQTPKEEPSGVQLEDIFALEGYSKQEKEFIVNEAKSKNLPINKAINDEGIKLGLDGLKAKVEKENKIPKPSSGESFSSSKWEGKPLTDSPEQENQDTLDHQKFEEEQMKEGITGI